MVAASAHGPALLNTLETTRKRGFMAQQQSLLAVLSLHCSPPLPSHFTFAYAS